MAVRRKHFWGKSSHAQLQDREYSLGIHWDSRGGSNSNLDIEAVIVNSHGMIVDAVYHNNLTALDGALGSNGDERDRTGIMEDVIWVDLTKMPKDIQLIFFVVCAHKHHHLADSDTGQIVLLDTVTREEATRFKLERSVADADVVGMMKRVEPGGAWTFMEVDDPAETGSHFVDIVEPIIGDLIRKEIPSAPKFQKVSFQMKKGRVFHLPGESSLKRLAITLDADVADDAHEGVEIDIAAVFYKEDGALLGAADCINDEMFGVAHNGELHYKESEHIDESLSIDLTQVPDVVTHIFIILTLSHGTFQQIDHLQTRILDQSAHDLATYDLPAGHSESGLILARLFCARTRLRKRWALEAVGSFFSHGTKHVDGATWSGHKAQKEMLKILNKAHPDKVKDPRHHHHHNSDDQSEDPRRQPSEGNRSTVHSSDKGGGDGGAGRDADRTALDADRAAGLPPSINSRGTSSTAQRPETGGEAGAENTERFVQRPVEKQTSMLTGVAVAAPNVKSERSDASPPQGKIPAKDALELKKTGATSSTSAGTEEKMTATGSAAPSTPTTVKKNELKKGAVKFHGKMKKLTLSEPLKEAVATDAAPSDSGLPATGSVTGIARPMDLGADDAVPVRDPDDPERPRNYCDDCTWSQRFGLFSRCSSGI